MHSIRWQLVAGLTAGAFAAGLAGLPWLAIAAGVLVTVALPGTLERAGAELELGARRISADRLELVLVYAWQMTHPSSAPASRSYAAVVACAVAGRRRR